MPESHTVKLTLAFPPLPDTITNIAALMRREDVEIPEVVALVEQDPASAAFLLKLANSPLYGQRGKVSSLHRAVLILGVRRTLQNLMSQALLRTRMGFSGETEDLARHIIQHSIVTALLTRKFMMYGRPPGRQATYLEDFTSDVFTAALLHDFGKLVLLLNLPEKAAAIYRKHREAPLDQPSFWLEQTVLGLSHVSLIKKMGQKFSFPMHIQHAMLLHHAPLNQLAQAPEGARRMALILIAANLAAHVWERRDRLEAREYLDTHAIWPLLVESGLTVFRETEAIGEALPRFWEEVDEELTLMN